MGPALSMSGRDVRRYVQANAFRLLAALMAVLLPLQGITGAMAAIQAPAHFHVRVASSAAGPSAAQRYVPPASEAKQQPHLAPPISVASSGGHDAGHSLDASPDRSGRAPAHAHVPAPHPHNTLAHRPQVPAPVHAASLPGVPPPTAATHAHHAMVGEQHIDARAGRQDALIGHHAHAFADAGVVYVEGDLDRPDSSAAGTNTAAADAALTGWWMLLRGAMGAQSLPLAHWRYQSHSGTPALRPPAATDALIA